MKLHFAVYSFQDRLPSPAQPRYCSQTTRDGYTLEISLLHDNNRYIFFSATLFLHSFWWMSISSSKNDWIRKNERAYCLIPWLDLSLDIDLQRIIFFFRVFSLKLIVIPVHVLLHLKLLFFLFFSRLDSNNCSNDSSRVQDIDITCL